jgi:Ca-activated chloride channel family protein
MHFANPEFLFMLMLLPLAWGFRRWRGRNAPSPSVRFANFLALDAAPVGLRARLTSMLPALRVAALVLVAVALARPQTEDFETLSGQGLDVMLCLDMSGSMNAVDMDLDEISDWQGRSQEPPNRFRIAVDTLKDFVKNRRGDRIGLVVFASEAYLKFPLTLDHATVLRQLDSLVLDNMERRQDREGCINNCTINGERTAIGDALSKAYKRLEKSDGRGKLIVLITDGNDNASKLKPMDVASYVGSQPDGARPGVYTFLVGGGPKSKIPARVGGSMARQMGFLSYVPYDEHVDEAKIREMVEAARGTFHAAYDEEQFRQAFSSLERSEHLEQKVALRKERFLPFLLAAIGLLLLEVAASVTVLRRFP